MNRTESCSPQCFGVSQKEEREPGEKVKILVIGGSYFYGRVFVLEAAKEHDITVVNRGSYPMAQFGVKEMRGDRKQENFLRECREDFDVVVDFNAYEPGDIRRVLQNLPGKVKQYIFISTGSVYRSGEKGFKDENAPFETREIPGEAGKYISGKIALEKELRRECTLRDIPYTVLRPAFIYGPYNYAPREPLFIQMMVQNHILPQITDAAGRFQMVYVKDAAEAVKRCLLNEKAYGQAYNLCQDEVMDYTSFLVGLEQAADVELQKIPMTAEAFTAQGLELPFPVTEEETDLYSNEKSKRELGMAYTDFQEGIARTYRAFRGVYSQEKQSD